MNLVKHSKVRVAGLSSFLVLFALLGLAVFCPSSYDEAVYADNITDTGTFSLDFILQKTTTANFTIDFLLSQKLAIKLGSLTNASVESQPVSGGRQFTGYTTFTASTNNQAGLDVLVYSNDGNTYLAGASANIPTVTSDNISLSSMTNQWGYNLVAGSGEPNYGTITFNALPANAAAAANKSVHGDAGSTTYRLAFGAKVDNTIAPDTYSRTVNVKVIPTSQQVTAVNAAADNYNALEAAGVEEMQINNNILDIITE